MDIKELIADSHLAFINQENEMALRWQKKHWGWNRITPMLASARPMR